MEKKLNIGLFIDTFYPMIDGVINVVDNYAKRLNEIANVVVFAPKPRMKNYDDSVHPYKIVRCKRLNLKCLGLDYDLPLPKLDKKFKKELAKANLDIIHIHSPFSIGKIATSYAKKHNIPIVATLHSNYERDFYQKTKNKFITRSLLKSITKVFNKCDVLWTMNPACAQLSRKFGYKGKINLIPNATDLNNSFSNSAISEFKKQISVKYNIKEDEKILINIGRINRIKNLDFLVDVCKKLSDKNFKYKLLLIGGGSDKNYFISKVKKLNLSSNIIFVGTISDRNTKAEFFAISDLHVFPSLYDTDGIVKIEAAALNVPTLFVENSMASSTITNGINGYTAPQNVEEFASKIIDIFNSNIKEVGKNAFNDLYVSWDDITKKVYEEYTKLIAK